MLLKHFYIPASILLLGCSSAISHAASDTTQIKVGVVVKAKSQCNYNYSSESNNSNFNRYSLNSTCEMNTKTIRQHLVSKVKLVDKENQRYRVMMTVQ